MNFEMKDKLCDMRQRNAITVVEIKRMEWKKYAERKKRHQQWFQRQYTHKDLALTAKKKKLLKNMAFSTDLSHSPFLGNGSGVCVMPAL